MSAEYFSVSATMSSVQHLRQFINERLNAAAEQIFTEFEKTIVQYEEEIDRQRRLLDITWKPQRNAQTTEAPQQYVCNVDEDVQDDDQQLCNQKVNSDLDQGRPESAPIKEEPEELPTSQGGELLLKEEVDSFLISAAYGEYENTSSVYEHFHVEGNIVEDSGPTRDMKPENSFQTEANNVRESFLSESHCDSHDFAEKQCFYDTCGQHFLYPSSLERHKEIHEKQFSCKTCGETFKDKTKFRVHMRCHTGEKPYSCQKCGKCYSQNSGLLCHMRTHTGEKPYFCNTCGKSFIQSSILVRHMITHTREKAYSCKTCGKSFHKNFNLLCHMRIHTGEKPYSCETCGKCFSQSSILFRHIKTHTGEKL